MVIPLFHRDIRFMRHGRTTANANGTVCGQTDLPLDSVGRAQVRRAAIRLSGCHFASIWTSGLRRARSSAEAVAEIMGVPVRILEDLGERDWGDWEGQPRSRLLRDATPPGGEGPEAFRERVLAGLARIEGPFPVLIVGHSGTARVIHAALSREPFERLGNAEVVAWRPAGGSWTRHTMVKERW